MDPTESGEPEIERRRTLAELEEWLEKPMLLLGAVWLGLLLWELTRGLNPVLEGVSLAIWGVFLLDFGLRLALAPKKGEYLRDNWLTAVSLLLPALRIFRAARALRVLRAARAVRGARLVKVVGSVNRGMRTLARTMGRRGFGYVLALTTLVTLAGAAGMYALERETSPGFADFGSALWWTAMLMTTLGSEFWPRSAEGRLLCLMLSLYAFAVFGYVTAALASYFVGQDAGDPAAELAGAAEMTALRREIGELRRDIRALHAGDESR